MRYFTSVQNLLINIAKDPVFYPGTEGLVACSWVFCCFVLEFNKRYFEDPPRGRCLHKYAVTLSLCWNANAGSIVELLFVDMDTGDLMEDYWPSNIFN